MEMGRSLLTQPVRTQHCIKVILDPTQPTRKPQIQAQPNEWIGGAVYNMVVGFLTSAVTDGVCYGYVIWKSQMAAVAHGIWNFTTFLVVVIFIFVFTYLMHIRYFLNCLVGSSWVLHLATWVGLK